MTLCSLILLKKCLVEGIFQFPPLSPRKQTTQIVGFHVVYLGISHRQLWTWWRFQNASHEMNIVQTLFILSVPKSFSFPWMRTKTLIPLVVITVFGSYHTCSIFCFIFWNIITSKILILELMVHMFLCFRNIWKKNVFLVPIYFWCDVV